MVSQRPRLVRVLVTSTVVYFLAALYARTEREEFEVTVNREKRRIAFSSEKHRWTERRTAPDTRT
jgi:hypothetical protein